MLAVLVSVLIGAVALLDSLENLNFLVLLAQAEQGSGPSDAAIGAQVLACVELGEDSRVGGLGECEPHR